MNETNAHLSANKIKSISPGFTPKLGIILGSGLGSFANELENTTVISYTELPGFPNCKVQSHAGNLVLGTLSGVNVVCLQGRAHTYEGNCNDIVKTYIRALKLLGCEELIITNATGSMRREVPPGEIVLINDHINMQSTNPLIGENDDDFGPRFFPLDSVYDKNMREILLNIAEGNNIPLTECVYLAVNGPNYETAAEIRAFQTLGADVVGMSTVPEVLVATHCGLKVAVLSIISNYATGLSDVSHSHEEVVITAERAANKLGVLVRGFLARHIAQ
ncbi:MAG: purine-nucleoside phosphorylase [Legionellales bacterium RIFCSPHIGHO2_12_FULL_35_11]|nr:MAG: purine-nucleoside phosphorylase [Legionellales bacterium RIFCSPHIGHO2_12_FULL_35_11]